MRPATLRDDRLVGWLTAGAVTALAAALRLPSLGRPHVLVFDETYYVKDAWTLLKLGYEAQWPTTPDPAFETGHVSIYSTTASYVVHPQVGKWLIAGGLQLLGAKNPVGWRLAAVLAGILSVLMLTRIARRLFRSTALGALAGGLLAIDGQAIVLSRTALLDGFLMMFVLAAFGALLIDRDQARARLERLTAPPRAPSRWGPGLGLRPWRLAGGVLLGLAIGTKWSALWFLAVFGVMTLLWDASARRRAAVVHRWQGTLLRDAVPAFLSLVPVALLTYLATWFSWFRTPGSYGRHWAQDHPGEGVTWLPPALRSLLKYHQDMWTFHTHLETPHAYAASPLGWLIQWRPTAFYYETPTPAQQVCGAAHCSEAVTSVGNPLIWWLGTLAVAACVWWALRRRDGVAAAALSGILAGWVPWFPYAHRTIFTFYAIVFAPWMILSLTVACSRLLRWGEAEPARRTLVRGAVALLVVLVVGVSWYFYPLWTAQPVTFRTWQLHQWLISWA
ncbi:MAG TPA: phospholipid carrier-dependent glycosyltransferase [Actinotalea sp.]